MSSSLYQSRPAGAGVGGSSHHHHHHHHQHSSLPPPLAHHPHPPQHQQPQRYSPSPEYVDAARHSGVPAGHRLPLRESTGNAQAHSFNGIVSCYQSPVAISPSMQPSLPAPMVPSQSFDCLYRVSTPRQQARYQRRPRAAVNPLYYWPAFRQYRNRQAHKDTQKDKGGVWRRPELEDAFVDSVLLMPHMGRRKFSMGGKLHGRNMLISEYIFVICVALLGSKEIFRIDNSNESIEQMGRKQVSSHMQVVKKFFEDLRCFHFLFPSEEKKEPGSTNSDDYYDEEEQESFKSNPVLTALAEGRVPDVRPNYEYFSQLLALQQAICVRPKTCEIFVSSSEIKMRDEVAYDANDRALDAASFPHLNKYSNCDDSPNVLGKDVLLHEYTRSLDRTTSACVKGITRRWQREAGSMYETLELPGRDEECLLLEMGATIELHEQAKFPPGSELTGFVEVAVTQAELQHHRWKCVTRLTRPSELHSDEGKQGVYTNESGIHRRGCSDANKDCECHARPRADIHVPFPAVEWASILSMAVQYPDVEHQRLRERRRRTGSGDDKKEPERTGSKRKRSEDEGDAASWARREPTGSDLICRVAMYQELWSCAPDSSQWRRQAILFWRFNTTNQWHKYNPVFKPAGTTWRWLTINDPMSRYHQQKALVYPSPGVPRDAVMSPTPTIGQHLTATMNETLSSAWHDGNGNGNGSGSAPQPQHHNHNHHVQQHQHPSVASQHHGPPVVAPIHTAGNAGLSLFESFPSGLATPPPTATLTGHFPSSNGSFDASNGAAVGYLASTGTAAPANPRHHPAMANNQGYYDASSSYPDVKPLTASNPSYMAASASLDMPPQLVYDNSPCDAGQMQAWDMTALDNWTGTGPTQPSAPTASPEWGPATGPKMDPQGQHHHQQHQAPQQPPPMWSSQWPLPPSSAAPAVGSHDRGASSPRPKRRRDAIESHVPVAATW